MKNRILGAYKAVNKKYEEAKKKAGSKALRPYSDEYAEKIMLQAKAEFNTAANVIFSELASYVNKQQQAAVNTLEGRSWIDADSYNRHKENLPVAVAGMNISDLLKLYKAKFDDPAYMAALEPAIDSRLAILPASDINRLEFMKLQIEAPKEPEEAAALATLKEVRTASYLLHRLESYSQELSETIMQPNKDAAPASLNSIMLDQIEQLWPKLLEQDHPQRSYRVEPEERYNFIIKNA